MGISGRRFNFGGVCVCVSTWVALFCISVHDDVRNRRHDLLDQTISQHGHSLMIVLCTQIHIEKASGCLPVLSLGLSWLLCFLYLHLVLGDAAGGSQPDGQRSGDGAGTQPPLLPAPTLQWLQTHPGPAAHVQSSHTCTYNTQIRKSFRLTWRVPQGSQHNLLLFKSTCLNCHSSNTNSLS